jgi:Gas vesicle synthesis protein GvpO
LADDEEKPRRARRTRRTADAEAPEAERREDAGQEPDAPDASADGAETGAESSAETGAEAGGENGAGPGADGRRVSAAVAARRAAQQVADFTGRVPECVVSLDRADGGWQIGVEVVETRRIPDTQDVLAIYEVHVDFGGDLLSYRRTRRYARGELDGACR